MKNNCKKWLRYIVALLILLVVSASLAADSQWDITLNIPYYFGLELDSEGLDEDLEYSSYLAGDSEDLAGNYKWVNILPFLIPDFQWHYYFGPEFLHFGPGVRLLTVTLQSVLYPVFSVESFLGDFILKADIGGGALLLFGLINTPTYGSIIIPELSVAYKLGKKKQFSLGTGGSFLLMPDVYGWESFLFTGTIFTRWTF